MSRLRKERHLGTQKATHRHSKRRGPASDLRPDRIDFAKRASQSRGWQTVTCTLYGQEATKTYKTFLATYRPVAGTIRVVLVKEEAAYHAFFWTDP